MTISNSTLTSDVFTDVRAVLVAANITAESITATVNATYNDRQPQRPQVTIGPATVDEDSFKFGSNEGKKFINIVVGCYYSKTVGVDQMYDQVLVAVKAAEFDGIELVAHGGDYAFNTANDQKFHLKSITFTFDRE